MQHQRDPNPRSDRGAIPAQGATPAAPKKEEREDDEVQRPTLESFRWEDEAVTARRSAPRSPLVSSPWEPVHPEELIRSSPPPPPTAGTADTVPPTQPSVGPVALEIDDDSPPARSHRAIFPLRGLLAIGAVAAALVALAVQKGGLGKHGPSPAAAVQPFPARPPAEEAESVPPPLAAPPEVERPGPPPPASTIGTLVGSPDHRLFVDGRRVPGWKVELPCGPHVARNGSHGTDRTALVPCGGTIAVTP